MSSIIKEKPATTISSSAAQPRAGEIKLVYSSAENDEHKQHFSSVLQRSGRLMLASDMMALLLAFVFGGALARIGNMYVMKGSFQSIQSFETLKQFIIFMGLGGLSLLWLDMRGHYRQRLPFWESIGHIMAVAGVGFLVCGFIQFVAQGTFSRLWLGLSWVLFGMFLFVGRGMVRRMLKKTGQWEIPAILVGQGPSAEAALHALNREPGMGFTIVEQIAPETLHQMVKPYSWKRLLMSCGASHLFLALEGGELQRQQPALKALMRERLPFSIIPPWMGLPSSTLSPHHFMLRDVMLMHDTNRLSLPLPCFLKRSFDILVSGLALIAVSPLMLFLAVMIRRDGGPAFFMQDRVGKGGKTFQCYKFRSMRIDAEAFLDDYLAANPAEAAEWHKYQKLKNDVRITSFGRFIRRTSVDELPQLINVLKGDMSLVGPRPIMLGQEHFYADDFVYYESVRPGITGPWQVSGRNKLTFKERVALEVCYARDWSLWMDIVIMLKTIPTVLKKGQAF